MSRRTRQRPAEYPTAGSNPEKRGFAEYVFIDERRLDSYFAQISGPVTYDKVPVWTANLSLTGPGAEGQQARFQRPYTTMEKLQRLLEHVQGICEEKGASDPFHIVEGAATRIYVPPQHNSKMPSDGIRIWAFTLPPLRLYLIEDYPRGDNEISFKAPSAFTAIWFLARDLRKELSLTTAAPLLDVVDELSTGNPSSYRDVIQTDLVDLLPRFGAERGPERRVRAFFREREHFTSRRWYDRGMGKSDPTPHVIIGYPISIEELSNSAEPMAEVPQISSLRKP